jgi:putative hydrolase of the HAD superfamily
MIKNIIFDAGGILFTSNPKFIKEGLIKKYNFSPLIFSDYPKEISKKYDKKLSIGGYSYKKALAEISNIKNMAPIYEDYKKLYLKSQKIDKKVINIVKKLSKKYNLFCLTNTVDFPLEINRKSGLFSPFKKVYGSCEIKVKKPSQEAFEFVLKDSHLNPIETLFIDDKLENTLAAKKIKMKIILFKDCNQLIKDLKKFGIETR